MINSIREIVDEVLKKYVNKPNSLKIRKKMAKEVYDRLGAISEELDYEKDNGSTGKFVAK